MTDIAELVRAHAGDLLRAALAFGVPSSDAEDLVQAVFAAHLEHPGRFEGRSSLKTYLFGILYNKAREHSRRKARELATDPADGVFEAGFSREGHWLPALPKGPDEQAASEEGVSSAAACTARITMLAMVPLSL